MKPSFPLTTSFISRRKFSRHLPLGLLLAATPFWGQSAQAITETWNGAGTGWQTGSNWSGTVAPINTTLTEFNSASYPNQPTTGASAAAAGAVWVTTGVNADVTVGGTGTLSIAGNLSALNGPGGLANTAILLDDSANHNLTISAPVTISNGTSFIVNNTGTLTIGGALTATGTLTLSGTGGTIGLGNTSSGGALAVNTTGTTVNLTGTTGGFSTLGVLITSGVVNVTGSITSTKGATVNGSGGTLNLNAANAMTGPLAISAGSVTENVANAFSGSATLTVSGGTVTLSQSNNYTGATTLSGTGALILGNAGALGSSTLTLNGGTLSTSSALTISNNVLVTSAGIGGTNDITLSGNYTNSGAAVRTTTINNTGATTLSGNVYLSDSATGRGMTFNGTGSATISGVIANSSTAGATASNLIYSGSGTLTLGNANTFTGTTGVSNGTLALNAAGAINSGNTVTVSSTGSLTESAANAISGTGTSVVLTAGSLALSTANNYTGNTTLTAGTASVGNKGSFGTGTVLLNGATLSASTDLSGANAIANAVNLTGNGTIAGSNNLTLSGTVTTFGASRTLTVNNTGTTALTGGNLYLSDTTTGHTLTLAGTGAVTIGDVIANSPSGTGAGGVIYSGSSTLSLTNNNTYTGVTSITGGTLSASTLALGTTSPSSIGQSGNAATNLLISNATLKYTGTGDTTDRLFTINGTVAGTAATLDASGSGAVNFSNTGNVAYGTTGQTRTLNLAGTSTAANTFALKINNNGVGAVSLTKSGTGTWDLTNANVYTGGTTINGGLLKVNNLAAGSATGSGTVTVNSTGALGGGMGAANGGTLGGLVYGATSKTYGPGLAAISGTVTVNSGGHLAPGNSVGTLAMTSLTLAPGAILDYEFNATANDFVSAGGTLSLSLGSQVGFNLYQEGTSSAFASAGTYNLIQYGALAGTGSIANLSVLNPQAGFSYIFINDSVDQVIQLNIAAVPEPETWAMMIGGLACLVVIQRRKVKSL